MLVQPPLKRCARAAPCREVSARPAPRVLRPEDAQSPRAAIIAISIPQRHEPPTEAHGLIASGRRAVDQKTAAHVEDCLAIRRDGEPIRAVVRQDQDALPCGTHRAGGNPGSQANGLRSWQPGFDGCPFLLVGAGLRVRRPDAGEPEELGVLRREIPGDDRCDGQRSQPDVEQDTPAVGPCSTPCAAE